MTNGEKFKTAKERAKAFDKYCDRRCRSDQSCSVAGCRKCLLDWLDLEAEEEKPLPCPFCGKTCTAISPTTPIGIMSKVSCNYCSYTSMSYNTTSEAIAAHNRVAKKCMEVKE